MSLDVILGTAQFGAAYGITNRRGRLSDGTVRDIVSTAVRGGVAGFDTALAYGDAEARLGAALRETAADSTARVITKLRLDELANEDLPGVVAQSRRRLDMQRIDILLHRPADVRDPRFEDIREGLRREQEAGNVGVVGVSVYNRAELEECLEKLPELGLIQVPGSVVDRRLLDDPILAELGGSVEIHVRSVFLQGLLLVEPEQLSDRHAPLRAVLQDLDAHAESMRTTRIALLLSAVAGGPVDAVVVGATSAAEIDEILAASHGASRGIRAPRFESIPEEVIDPRLW